MNEADIPQSTIAVLIDYENLALGTSKRKKNSHQEIDPLPDIQLIFKRLVDKGRITTKRAYCDWQRVTKAITPLHELGIELIEIPDRAITGKNSADIRLAVDAMEICLTKDYIDTFAILSGDSDFSPLVAKLKEYGKTVIGVGMKESTSALLAEVCDEFLFYEDLCGDLLGIVGIPSFTDKIAAEKYECYRLLFETIDALLHESDGFIHASRVKETMKRKNPKFSERSYGYRSFTALLHEASSLGLIKVHVDPRSSTVVIDGFRE